MSARRSREELGIAGEDSPDINGLFHQKYRGSRYSFGYPACPNLEDQSKLFDLLDGAQIGVLLSAGEAGRDARGEATAAGQMPVVLLVGEALTEAFADAGVACRQVIIPEVDEAFLQ